MAKPLRDLLRNGNLFEFYKKEKIAFLKLNDYLKNSYSIYTNRTVKHTYIQMQATLVMNGQELKVLAMIQALKTFRVYLLETKFKIITSVPENNG